MSMDAQYMAACVCAKFLIRYSQKSLCIAAFAGSLRLHLTFSHSHCFITCSPGRQAGMYLPDPRSPLIALCVPAF